MNKSGGTAERLMHLADIWHVTVGRTVETSGSIVALGIRAGQGVALKVIKSHGDEWFSGSVLAAFEGHGMVRVLDHVPGGILLEEIRPGEPLVTLVRQGRDAEAAEVIAEVIAAMHSEVRRIEEFPTVEEWGEGFNRYLASGADAIPADLVEEARELYSTLCRTQGVRRLLHGDLQHYNILFDDRRGWTGIDPKGVVGELAYELGAALRNPHDTPELFQGSLVVERRIKHFARLASVDSERVAGWTFAQAVLSAIWTHEDGEDFGNVSHGLELARVIRPVLN